MSYTPAPAPSTPVRTITGLLSPPPTPSFASIHHTRCNICAPPPTITPSKQDGTEVPVPPLQVSSNRWDRKALAAVPPNSPEMVDRKVTALLNKLTIEKFDSISYQLIARANDSEKEKDARTLAEIVRLIYEKAVDEPIYSAMYARLCRKMMEQIYDEVQNESVKDSEGKPVVGGQLFRKYLLNRCQEGFKRGWVAGVCMVPLYSDEYYAARKARRQGLGLIKFIGELFKLQRLTERIMHEFVKKFLGSVDNPREKEIESLCTLLTTVGGILDTPKARAHLDVYFSRMKELTKNINLSRPLRNMLLDLINLRERKWVGHTTLAVPTTIAQIHELAVKEVEAAEKAHYQRQIRISLSTSRGGDGSDHPRVGQIQKGGIVGHVPRSTASTSPRPPSPKAGDTLPDFAQISSSESKIRAPTTPPSLNTCTDVVCRPRVISDRFSMHNNQAQPGALVAREEASERILQHSTMTGSQGVNHKRQDLMKMISESLRHRSQVHTEATTSLGDQDSAQRPGSEVRSATHNELEGSEESDIAAIKRHVRSLVERMKEDESPESNSGPRKEAKYINFSVRDETDKTMIAIVNLSLIVNEEEAF